MSLSGLTVPTELQAESRAGWARHYDSQAIHWDMKADGLPPGDPMLPACRAEAERCRASALKYRGNT